MWALYGICFLNVQWSTNLKIRQANIKIQCFLIFLIRIRDWDSACCRDKIRLRDLWFAAFQKFSYSDAAFELESYEILESDSGFGSNLKICKSKDSFTFLRFPNRKVHLRIMRFVNLQIRRRFLKLAIKNCLEVLKWQ